MSGACLAVFPPEDKRHTVDSSRLDQTLQTPEHSPVLPREAAQSSNRHCIPYKGADLPAIPLHQAPCVCSWCRNLQTRETSEDLLPLDIQAQDDCSKHHPWGKDRDTPVTDPQGHLDPAGQASSRLCPVWGPLVRSSKVCSSQGSLPWIFLLGSPSSLHCTPYLTWVLEGGGYSFRGST